jgi:CheY-like chemotaxis protein
MLVAADGEQSLGLLREDRPVDLIRLDLMLPKVSCRDVLRAVRSDPRRAGVPVVVATASAEAKSVEGSAAGCRGGRRRRR